MKRKTVPNPEYEDYQRLLASKAWQHCRNTGCEFNEAMSTANLAFFEAKRTYKPALASFTTHLWYALDGHFAAERLLLYELNRDEELFSWHHWEHQLDRQGDIEHKRSTALVKAIHQHRIDHPGQREVPFRDWLKDLSQHAQQLVSLVFNSPCDYIGITMLCLTKTLAHQLGWKWTFSQAVIAEIKESLASYPL